MNGRSFIERHGERDVKSKLHRDVVEDYELARVFISLYPSLSHCFAYSADRLVVWSFAWKFICYLIMQNMLSHSSAPQS